MGGLGPPQPMKAASPHKAVTFHALSSSLSPCINACRRNVAKTNRRNYQKLIGFHDRRVHYWLYRAGRAVSSRNVNRCSQASISISVGL